MADLINTAVAVHNGFGRHAYYLILPQVENVVRAVFIDELLVLCMICFAKLSIALFLLRIGGLRRWLRYMVITTMFLQVTSSCAFFIVSCLECRPLAGIWNPEVRATATCLPAEGWLDSLYASNGKMSTILMTSCADASPQRCQL